MIAETGLAALWLAAALALYQLGLALGLAGDQGRSLRPARLLAVGQAGLTLVSFACLIVVFATTDLSVKLVAANSHSMKPFLYKWSGAWGNHEGSMLLWVTVLTVAGGAIAMFERRLGEAALRATLAAQSALAVGFFAFLLFASNPFARLNPAAIEGRGLNPILQDPGLTFHPPTLYIGYVGLSVAFSVAVGALWAREVGAAAARAMRPWVLGAWIFLTLGITAGSWWAYYELGWGGWWFWDPVENASLMPWLAATALLHSINVLAARGALKSWTMMLAVIAFSMSMVGTFLVRSGILTSVHAFAVDPRRGTMLLLLLALYIGGALALYGARIASVRDSTPFDPVSREGALTANNLLLALILGVTFIGTLYPLVAEAATRTRLSVGPPYFNAVAGPVALILVTLLMLGPQLRWKRDRLAVLPRLSPGLLVALAALVASFILAPDMSILSRLGLALGIGLVPASLMPLFGRALRRTPLPTWGMALSHLGVAVALIGMSADSAFTVERLALARPGDRMDVGPWLVEFRDVRPATGSNWTALQAEIRASRGGGVTVLEPQSRVFAEPQTTTSEAAIATVWNGQLYAVLGEPGEDGGWQLRLWWKPFVTLIWFGGLLIALGGTLALVGRAWTARRTRQRLEMFE